MECGCDVLNLIRRFMHEFETKVTNTNVAPGLDVRACFLRFGAEHRIPAANVGEHGMRTAMWIAQSHPMVFTWPAAISISSSGGKESAKHAMLCVEDWQVLIGDGLQAQGANSFC